MNPQWADDVIADCRQLGIAPFFKQWGTYKSNPLVFMDNLSENQASSLDPYGKGGGLFSGQIVREFPSVISGHSIQNSAA